MELVLVGATGGTGSQILAQAAALGIGPASELFAKAKVTFLEALATVLHWSATSKPASRKIRNLAERVIGALAKYISFRRKEESPGN